MAALKAEAAEREARLRSSRAEIMEARASAQDKELKLREVYQQLAEAGAERARLRDELTRTRMELADTQADLEALADEILSIKDLVLSEGELEELDTVLNAEQSSDEEALPEGSVAGSKQGGQGTEPTPSPASIAPSRASQGVAAGASGVDAASELASVASIAAQGTWDMLQSLAEFSRQVLEDAQQDEAAFTGSGILKGLPGFPGSFSGGKSTSQRPGNAQDEVCGDRDRP